jgi:REP element-mobilizing transposase RayT
MPRGLHRYYGAHELHFITCSCYHRRPNLRSTPARNRFFSILEQTRKRYRFVVVGYVIMPEQIHLLLSEPEVGTISTVMQVLKQRTARALLPKVKPDPLYATHPSQKAREGRATRPVSLNTPRLHLSHSASQRSAVRSRLQQQSLLTLGSGINLQLASCIPRFRA